MITTTSPPLVRSNNIGGSFIHSHGTRVYMRPRLDVVFDAVQQARFNERKWVWVENAERGYVKGHILNEDGDYVQVQLDDGQIADTTGDKVHPMNPPQFDMVDDMAELTHLNEPSVIHNLTGRYRSDKVYTYSGLFLVAVNPYRKLSIYSDESIRSYRGRRRGELPPHIYTVADQAYHDMLQDNENQSILITGESGAGKTENTKIVIQYLTSVANHNKENKLEQQILQANPILEAFGNAQTIRNNNSSRFGKFIRIEFNNFGQISGAHIDWYLFEKSRLHKQTKAERNYHVFYQLLNADQQIKKQLLLDGGQPSDYAYTANSNYVIDGVSDAIEFGNLMNSMNVMGFTEEEKLEYLRIVAIVLHIGNVVVSKSYGGDHAEIRDDAALSRVCDLLQVPLDDFKNGLLKPRLRVNGSWVVQNKSAAQVKASLEAFAKIMYERNFAMLVGRINQAIDGKMFTDDDVNFIGVLDIAGFEIFDVNSFEQLCINYTNEKLQQFFNHHMFVLEQLEYQKEKIDWEKIDFGMDLQPTIDLIEKNNPTGIFSCLEEECVAPSGNETRFLQKLDRVWVTNKRHSRVPKDEIEKDKYVPDKFGGGFAIQHYAGRVHYSVEDWVDKNKDPLNEFVARQLAQSKNKHISAMFEDYKQGPDDLDVASCLSMSSALLDIRKGTGSFNTVSQRHKKQLANLMHTLDNTRPHFVRCILPNHRKRPGDIDVKLVLDQLRCNGVLEGIRLCRKGYPNRLPFAEFRKRYEVLCPGAFKSNQLMDGRTACQLLLNYMGLDADKYRIGVTKIFFRATVLAELEHNRDKKLGEYITDFQASCRGFISRRRFTRFSRQTEAIKVMQRNARLFIALREWSWWKTYSMLKPLCEFYETDVLIKEQEQQIADLGTKLETEKAHNQQLLGKNQQLELEQEEYKILLESEQTMLRELQDSKQCLADDLAAAEERQDEMALEMEQLKVQLARLQQENDAQAKMITTMHNDIRECSDDNDRLAAEGDVLRERLQRAESEQDQLQTNHTQSQQAVKDLQHTLDDTNSRLDETSKRLVDLEGDLDSRQQQLDKETAERTALAQKCMDLEGDLVTQAEQGSVLNQRCTDLQEKFDKETKERQALAQRCTDLEAELATQKQASAEAEQKNQALTSERDKLQQSLSEESSASSQWQAKNVTLQSDWEQLTSIVKAEILESRSRATRLDQLMATLKTQS